MRNEILQLKDLGRMPNESINDTESIDELVNTYDALLEQIQLPISFDEEVLHMRQLLKTKLVDMDLSVRALNCLKAPAKGCGKQVKNRLQS